MITFHIFDEKTGTLKPKQILPTLPDTFTGNAMASAILVHPEGNFIYISNRFHDSIAAFSIDQNTGYLHPLCCESSLGKTPRFMTFDEAGDHLYVANEESDTIQVFNIDKKTGRLEFSNKTIYTESPVCILFSKARSKTSDFQSDSF
jgi:6-phosphogluconolactonase (cycloisomerase 2 family)